MSDREAIDYIVTKYFKINISETCKVKPIYVLSLEFDPTFIRENVVLTEDNQYIQYLAKELVRKLVIELEDFSFNQFKTKLPGDK